jgi:type IV pilus biogenesis protein CpaD/CtpE
VETWQVIIEPGSRVPAEVVRQLSGQSLAAQGISVELREAPLTFRGADPAIIVAVIGAVSANLTALIAGLLQLKANGKARRISIELASGEKLEVPADCSPEQIDRLVKSLGSEPPRRLILP